MAKPSHVEFTGDDKFVAYYAEQSQSKETVERFARIRDRALDLWSTLNGGTVRPLDVVDIGCGAGTQAMLWAEAKHRVSALDVNEALVSLGRKRAIQLGLDISFDVGTAMALPYADATADICLLPELLEHVDDWERCLSEAIRVLRGSGVLYLSTTNKLCPRQQEFYLPLYSWYPRVVKRWCERAALTTHPEWVNHTRCPAIHWFTYFQLDRWLGRRGMTSMDRFDMLARHPQSKFRSTIVAVIRTIPPLRIAAHVASAGTTVWSVKTAADLAVRLDRPALQ